MIGVLIILGMAVAALGGLALLTTAALLRVIAGDIDRVEFEEEAE